MTPRHIPPMRSSTCSQKPTDRSKTLPLHPHSNSTERNNLSSTTTKHANNTKQSHIASVSSAKLPQQQLFHRTSLHKYKQHDELQRHQDRSDTNNTPIYIRTAINNTYSG
jgi:hypothetical protein